MSIAALGCSRAVGPAYQTRLKVRRLMCTVVARGVAKTDSFPSELARRQCTRMSDKYLRHRDGQGQGATSELRALPVGAACAGASAPDATLSEPRRRRWRGRELRRGDRARTDRERGSESTILSFKFNLEIIFLLIYFLVLSPYISGSGPQLKFLFIGSSYFIVI
jgi:hypothetical protein